MDLLLANINVMLTWGYLLIHVADIKSQPTGTATVNFSTNNSYRANKHKEMKCFCKTWYFNFALNYTCYLLTFSPIQKIKMIDTWFINDSSGPLKEWNPIKSY